MLVGAALVLVAVGHISRDEWIRAQRRRNLGEPGQTVREHLRTIRDVNPVMLSVLVLGVVIFLVAALVAAA